MNTKYRHHKYWYEGLATKVETGRIYGSVEFDKLLGNYDVSLYTEGMISKRFVSNNLQAVTDCPCANFAEELIDAYPNAKVIPTTREPDGWVKSIESCYYQILKKPPWNPVVYLDPNGWGAFLKMMRMILVEISGSTDWKD